MATPRSVPQNFSTTLNVGGGIDNSQTTGIVLTSVSGLPTDGGILCFDWAATLDTATAEYIEYTGISGNELTGVTRGQEGVSAKAHNNGCTVVGIISKSHINRLRDKQTGNDAAALEDTNGNEILKVAQVNSAVNELTLTNAATGNPPIISATGGDTNIDLKVLPKGTGVLTVTGTTTYEANVTDDDDIPNKKYVDDEITASAPALALQNITQTNLGAGFTAAANTSEQEVTGLRVSLPIVSGGTSCTVKILLKVYWATVAGDNTLRIRVGTSTSYLTNTEKDNLYVSGAKTLETFTGVVVVTGLDLTAQNYVVVSVQNGTNASGMTMSASGSRSTIVTEVYK